MTDEGERDHVDTLGQAHFEISTVLLCEGGNSEFRAGKVDPLVAGDASADQDAAAQVVAAQSQNFQFDETICEKDPLTCVHVFCQPWIADGELGHGVVHRVLGLRRFPRGVKGDRSEFDLLAGLKLAAPAGDLAQADFRALEILENGNRTPEFIGDPSNPADGSAVFVMVPVREVEADDVGPRLKKSTKFLLGGACRAERADDSSLCHGIIVGDCGLIWGESVRGYGRCASWIE